MTSSRFLAWSWFAPLPAVAVGLAIALAHGVPWSAYAPNLAALGLVAIVAALARLRPGAGSRAIAWAPVVASVAIACTLLAPGIDGVHRWLGLGGLRVHASSAFAPWLLVRCTSWPSWRARLSRAALVLVQLVHVAQPDAGQATALAIGALPLLLAGVGVPRRVDVPLAAALLVLAAVAWSRADPLAPVDHIERILVLAFAGGWMWTVAAALAIVALVLPLAIAARGHGPAAWAAVVYLLATVAVTFLGAFPVPVLGAGAAPVLGWYALRRVGAAAVECAPHVPRTLSTDA
ncbi:MAG: hypothetical protein IPK74_19760 [Deltaproteobacteria bacterium]|nr:hypothetical protein [Deltaproteobacteria bacterium]